MIPLYKASPHIEILWNSLIPVLQDLKRSCEVLFVDDGSPDDGVEKILALKNGLSRSSSEWISIRIIRLVENSGQQTAVYCGLEQSRGDLVLTMDDDLQHPPEFIPVMLKLMMDTSRGLDVLFALPERDERGRHLRWGSRMRDLLFRRFLKAPAGITPSSFRIFSRRAVDTLSGASGNFVYVSALLFCRSKGLMMENIEYPLLPGLPGKDHKGHSRFTQISRVLLYIRLLWFYALSPVFNRKPGRGRPYTLRDEL